MKRRDITFDILSKIDGVICKKPTGAFYIIAKLPVEDAEDFALWMLQEFDDNGDTIMFSPVADFYATKGLGNDEVRIVYILEEKDLIRAMNILKKGLEAYISRK